MKKALIRGEEFLDKHQLWVLLLQLAGIVAMTAYICCNKALDWDEAYSFQMVTKYSFGEMIQKTAADIHPPLYYILLRLFCGIFGTDFLGMKLFSVLFETLTMVLGITLVRKNWGWRTAFVFNLVVGLGPQFIFYSVNIRMYSMALFFVTLCVLLAYEIIKNGRTLYWVLFVLSALGGVYTHYFTVIPLAFIYGYLLVGLIAFERKKMKCFLICCVGTILLYLPWLSIVVKSFQRFGTTGQIVIGTLDFADLFRWAFGTNIEFSELMPVFLLGFGIVLLIIERKKFTAQEKLFMTMCASIFFFTYIVSRLIASMNGHFWDNRYVFAAMGTFWLFLSIIYTRQGTKVFCTYSICLAVVAASAFVVQKANELGTVAYLTDTYRVLEPVREEKTVIYDYDTYQVLYGAHLPEQEFVFYDEVDFSKLEKDYVYFISWAGNWFQEETIEKYNIIAEDCGTMRFEEGVDGVKLYKLIFDKEGVQ